MAIDQDDIIAKARQITGNKTSVAVGEQMVPDEALEVALSPTVRRLSRSFGSSSSLKEVVFTATPGVQDYSINDNVGEDVRQIVRVLRSGEEIPNWVYEEGEIDPRNGLPLQNTDRVIPVGQQGSVFDVIIGQARSRRSDRFEFEVIGDTLRLMPVPTESEIISVRFVSSGGTMEDLPDACHTALVYATVVAILNGQINRIMSDRATTGNWGEAQSARLEMLERQRDYYQGQYDSEVISISNG